MIVLDTQCAAKTVFVVDHLIDSPLLLLVAKELVIEDMGAVAFSNCIDHDVKEGEAIFRPYLRRIYDRAVTRGLLTAEEVRSVLEDNTIIFKTAAELRGV